MLDFVNRTADLGTTGPLAKRKRTYQGQTVTAMRQDTHSRFLLLAVGGSSIHSLTHGMQHTVR